MTGEARSEILRIDNTKRSAAASCLRKYYYQHEAHIKPKKGSSALRYGIVWHAAMDAFYTHIQENGWRKDGKSFEIAVLTARMEWAECSRNQVFYEDYRTLPNLIQSLLSYMNHFALDEGMLEIIASEQLFEIPMVPETMNELSIMGEKWFSSLEEYDKGPFFIFTGMIDLEVMLNGEPWIIDHKTTGKSISQVQQQLRNSPQFIGYSYAASKELAVVPSGFLVVIHHLSAYRSKKTDLYGAPKIDFARNPEIYTPYDVAEWRIAIFEIASRVHKCRRIGVWPKNLDSCYMFGRCEFADLCEQQRPPQDVILGDSFFIDDPWDIIAETEKRNSRREALLSGKVVLS